MLLFQYHRLHLPWHLLTPSPCFVSTPRLFTEAPETKALFGYVDGVALTKLRAQGSRFVHTMKNLIGILDMDGVLQESLAHLRAQHGVRHLKPEYYTVGESRVDYKSNMF